MQFLGVCFLFALCTVYAAEGDCTDSVYGTVANGETGYAGCEGNLDGFRSAVCTNGSFGQTDASHCVPREASVFSYGISEMTIKKGSQFPTLSLQTDGSFTTFEITPELPTGLNFNAQNGAISGTPSVSSPETTYTISSGESSTTLKITVRDLTCPAIDGFPETADGQTASSVSDCLPGYTGVATRECEGGVWGTLDTSDCQPLSPSGLYYTGEMSVKRGEYVLLQPTVTNKVASYVSTTLPAGLSIDVGKGVISGIVTAPVGTYTFTVTASLEENSTTTTVTLVVSGGSCTGLKNDQGADVTTLHGQNLYLSCPTGYSGYMIRRCEDGVYQDPVDTGCIPQMATSFTYPLDTFTLSPGEEMNSGLPSFDGKASFFSVQSPLPEGFSIDPYTGVVSGTSETEKSFTIVVYAQASNSTIAPKAQTSIQVEIRIPSCEAMTDYKMTDAGTTVTYNCPEGYEGAMKRKCQFSKGASRWSYPDTYCQKNQDFTFLFISIAIFVVCLIVLLIGCCVKSSRTRKETRKALPKETKHISSKKTQPAPSVKKTAKVTV